MTFLSSRLLWSVAAGAVLGAVPWVIEGPGGAEGAPAWNVFEDYCRWTESQARSGQLEAQCADVQQRIGIKKQIVDEVIAERLSLLEAAACFRELNDAYPDHLDLLRRTHPGKTDEEVLCRNVIAFVRSALRDPAGAAVIDRLEAELDGRLEAGTLILQR